MTTATKPPAQKDDAPEQGKMGGIQEFSLRAAGISFMVADIALMISGWRSGKGNEAWAAACGLSAGVVGARYGNPKAERQLQQIEQRLGAYLRKQGIEIPKDPTTENLTKEGGVIQHMESFLYKYPSQIMNVFYAMIGGNFVLSGLKQTDTAMYKRPILYSGALLIAGALANLLIEEKKRDPNHPPEGVVEKAKSWVQEAPLRFGTTLFTANQISLGMDAFKERREIPEKNSYQFKMVAVAAFVLGNTLMGLSPKAEGGNSKLDKKAYAELAQTCKTIIQAQPPAMQQDVLELIAAKIADEPMVRMKPAQIKEMLQAELVATPEPVGKRGWQERVGSTVGNDMAM